MAQKNKHKITNIKLSKNTIAIAIFLLSVIAFISVVSQNFGVIGKFIGSVHFKLFGKGAYVFPILISVLCLLVIINRFHGRIRKNYIFVILLYICFLILLDLQFIQMENIDEKIQSVLIAAESGSGSGIVGAFLGFALYNISGHIGIYIFIALVCFFSLMSFLNLTFQEVIKEVKVFLEQKIGDFREKKREEKKVIQTSAAETAVDVASSEKNNISIMNYIDDKELTESDENFQQDSFEKQASFTQIDMELPTSEKKYTPPPIELLKESTYRSQLDNNEMLQKAQTIEQTLRSFGIEAKVVKINRGPTVTCFELEPDQGIKVSRIVNLADNLSLSLATSDIRIEAPIPGKPYVGIEVPNSEKDIVTLKEIIKSEEYVNNTSPLSFAVGKDISGKPIVSSIDKMPHLLVAGATGSGKSVCINTIILSILYKQSPQDVKLLLIDPKVVELSIYNGIPHLVTPVVTNPKEAKSALSWAVGEMERRYKLFSKNSVRDIAGYRNKRLANDSLEELPYIIIIIDELSDLMMISAQEVENYICRLAQMARACGIHLIIATQRPTVDVITGTIKANIPSRISFAVSSQTDSRTILDMGGAEKLLGKGDMLFYPSSSTKPLRIQGAFISDKEVEDVVHYIRNFYDPNYDEEILSEIQSTVPEGIEAQETDELINEAIELVSQEGHASVSLLQRRLRVGYARAGRIIDQLESMGIVGPYEGSKPRKVLVDKDYVNTREE